MHTIAFCLAAGLGSGLGFSGRVFHSWTAATGKARSPMVERRVRRTSDMMTNDERRMTKRRIAKSNDWSWLLFILLLCDTLCNDCLADIVDICFFNLSLWCVYIT